MIRRACWSVARYVVLLVFAIVAAYPLVWMFVTALRTRTEVTRDKWALPASPTLDNFRQILTSYDFPRFILNSLVVVGSAVILTMAAAALAAFVFARMRFRGRSVAFYLILAGMMIPVHIVLIPLVKIAAFMGIRDTHVVLILTYVAFSLPVSVVILRGFFEGIPVELEEAARIDGCSDFGVFLHVMLPLAKPALAVVAIFNTITLWNEFVFALVLLDPPRLWTIPLGIFNLSEQYGVDLTLACAAMSVAVLPVLIAYFIAQKHIIRGLTSGAVKG